MIEIEIETTELTAALDRLMRAGQRPQPALQATGEYLVESTKRRFSTKTAPDGSPWPANAESVIAQKGRNDPLVGESKRLSREIHYRARGDLLEIGSPLEYAAAQHFGMARGYAGKTKHGVPIPWADIPARPFLGFSAEDRSEILQLLEEHMRGSWSR